MTRLLRLPVSVFHGWWVVAGATCIQALQGLLFFQSFGVYAPFWMAEFGWTRTTVSLIHSLHRTESGLLGPVHGWLLQRYGARRVVLGGMLMLGAGFVALGFVRDLAQFLAVFLLMAVGVSLCGFLSLMTMVVNWFERLRARAMAVVALGISLGGLLVPVLAWLLVTYGWRPVAIGSGVVYLLLAWPLGRVFVDEPEAMGLRPDGVEVTAQAEAEGAAPARPLDTRRVLRSREFWLLSLGHSNALAIVGAVTVHFVIYVGEKLELGVTTAAAMFTLITLCQVAGQALGGVLGDRYDKRWLAAAGMAMHTLAMVVLVVAGSAAAVGSAAVLHGLAWGLRGPLMSAMRADYFGRKAFAMVMGYSSLIIMVGSVVGPLLVGLLTDLRGEYGLAFGALAVLGAVGVVAFLVLPPAPRRAPAAG
ncbi:MAG TPA: MFS transporter [Trueperaceae bacterium]|nr:MFS transporter [Trueperaceae bacterium]